MNTKQTRGFLQKPEVNFILFIKEKKNLFILFYYFAIIKTKHIQRNYR